MVSFEISKGYLTWGRTKESGGKNNGMSVNYAEVIEYVKKMTSENGRPSNYPFRSRFEHTMRVYRWAIKLQSKLGGDLDVIVLAALLHDIGWDDERPHGEVGAELAVEYMDSIGIDPETIRRVGEIIMIHEDKDSDADLSICWMKLARSVCCGIRWRQHVRMRQVTRKPITGSRIIIEITNQRFEDARQMQPEQNIRSVCSCLTVSSSSWKRNYFRKSCYVL